MRCERALRPDWPQGQPACAWFLPFSVFLSSRGTHCHPLVYVEDDSHGGDSFRGLLGEQKALFRTISIFVPISSLPVSPPSTLHPHQRSVSSLFVTSQYLGLMLSKPCFTDLSPPLHCFCLVSTVHLPFAFFLTCLKPLFSGPYVSFFSPSNMWDCLGSGDKLHGVKGKEEAPLSPLGPS